MRAPPSQNEQIFDEYADKYEDTVNAGLKASGESVEFFAQLKARLVAMHLRDVGARAPERLLDFGCGTGLSTRTLMSELDAGCQCTGLDVSGDSIERAREQDSSGRSTYVYHPGGDLPFADGTFDVAFSACVFHHIERDEHVRWLREIRRVLRPDGLFFLFEHNPRNPLTVRSVKACPFDEGVVLLDSRYARDAMRQATLQPRDLRYYFFFPQALRALRPLERRMGWLPLGAQYYLTASPAAR